MSARGFTLIETLVALLVLAGFVTMFGSGVIGSWRSVSGAESEKRALTLARNVMEGVGTVVPLQVGTHAGIDAGGLDYRISVRPHRQDSEGSLDAYWVTVTVFGRTATSAPRPPVVLQTLKTARRHG